MDREVRQDTIHGTAESDMSEQENKFSKLKLGALIYTY